MYFFFCQFAAFSAGKSAETNLSYSYARQSFNIQMKIFRHAADLAVLSFTEHEFIVPVAQLPDDMGRELIALIPDAA